MSQFYNDCVFGTREELMEWVPTTACSLGYAIVTQRSKENVLGIVKKIYLMCDSGDEYMPATQSTTHSGTRKCGCPFQLMTKYINDPKGWIINVICDEHNHQPAIFLEGHAFAKRLSKKEFGLVEDLTKKNMVPRDILSQLKKNDDQNVSTSETVYDARRRIHKAERLGQTPMQSMVKYLHASEYVYYIREEPGSNQVHDLFFVNPISMMMWRAFPHVLILDPTYKTNRYHIPFLQIVGLTSTNKTFCVAFAFIRNEKTDNCKWVLRCLRQTLDGYMLPWVIVTDKDLALVGFERQYRNAFQNDYNEVFSSLHWWGTGFAPQEHWMIMPETGFFIANKFDVIFHFISKECNNSSTLFPLWRGPDQFPNRLIVTIALVNSNHFVMVEMEGEFPMATTNNLWTIRRQTEAAHWQRVFISRQMLYKNSTANTSEYFIID